MKSAASHSDTPGVAIQVSRNVVVASVQVDLDTAVLDRFRQDLLQRIHDTGSRGVILDLSGLETLDSTEFADLRQIISMSSIMGAEPVLAGLRPGVVSALIEAGAEVDGLRTALDLDAAYALLESGRETAADPGSDTVAEDALQDEPTEHPPECCDPPPGGEA